MKNLVLVICLLQIYYLCVAKVDTELDLLNVHSRMMTMTRVYKDRPVRSPPLRLSDEHRTVVQREFSLSVWEITLHAPNEFEILLFVNWTAGVRAESGATKNQFELLRRMQLQASLRTLRSPGIIDLRLEYPAANEQAYLSVVHAFVPVSALESDDRFANLGFHEWRPLWLTLESDITKPPLELHVALQSTTSDARFVADVGACVPVPIGDVFDELTLVRAFVHYYAHLGVTQFFLYELGRGRTNYEHVSADMTSLLGVRVDVHGIKLNENITEYGMHDSHYADSHEFGLLLRQKCLMRHRHEVRWLAFLSLGHWLVRSAETPPRTLALNKENYHSSMPLSDNIKLSRPDTRRLSAIDAAKKSRSRAAHAVVTTANDTTDVSGAVERPESLRGGLRAWLVALPKHVAIVRPQLFACLDGVEAAAEHELAILVRTDSVRALLDHERFWLYRRHESADEHSDVLCTQFQYSAAHAEVLRERARRRASVPSGVSGAGNGLYAPDSMHCDSESIDTSQDNAVYVVRANVKENALRHFVTKYGIVGALRNETFFECKFSPSSGAPISGGRGYVAAARVRRDGGDDDDVARNGNRIVNVLHSKHSKIPIDDDDHPSVFI